jgi:hypothetical protein
MTKTQHDRLLVRALVASLAISACVPPFEREDEDGDDKGNNKGGASNGGTSGGPSAACFECADDQCANEAAACDSTDGCRAMAGCMLGCEATDSTCLLDCVPQTSAGVQAYSAAAPYYACALACPECSGSSGGTGGSSGTGSGGDSGAGGTDSIGGDSGTGGTTGGAGGTTGGGGGTFPTGGSSGKGGAGGTFGGSPTGGSAGTPGTGIQWLSLDGSWADPATEPNAALQVSGAFYAFGDTCAQVYYDTATRCVSGMLCSPGPTFANWGAAVGFDFHTTGAEGSPPNLKTPWNASNVGALGIAWQISGSAPGLQVWITNMDPIWNGMCTADDCGINGPPDGKASTILGVQDTLNFGSMVKDNWGGSGTFYTFNRANVLAIQFKLAAVISGPTPFSFCIDRLGVIL